MKKIILIVLFAISLYAVEWSSIGSNAIAQYNDGYGTFDMKSYSYDNVNDVLSRMRPQGFVAYQRYFIADFAFIITFGLLQITLLVSAFRWTDSRKIKYAVCIIPVLRGIFDIVENVLLLVTIHNYPILNRDIINVASAATAGKLLMIKLWSVALLIGIVGNLYYRIKNKRIKKRV